ncbi:MAG: inositol monophosphatase family protein [Microcystaceae cyanobacterium]
MNTELNQRQCFLEVATEAALAAGAILQDLWGNLDNIQEKGISGDLVTEADQKAEALILSVIQRHFRDHAILTEESGHFDGSDTDYLWAIDPLDGTTNYAHSYPVSAVSIALLRQGTPHVGVIYDPFRQELFRGATGLGATLNRRPIQVSQTEELAKSLLVSGFAYDRCQTFDTNYPEFCYLTHLTQGVRRSGSASLDLAHVACGRLDGYWERGIKLWDIAAGWVILTEAGGKVTAYDGSPIKAETGRILATNGKIHPSLSDALQNALEWLKTFYCGNNI